MQKQSAVSILRIVCLLQVWENLQIKSSVNPIASNRGGSYLTMFSKGGLVFGVINVIGNFGTVFNDQVRRPVTCGFCNSAPPKPPKNAREDLPAGRSGKRPNHWSFFEAEHGISRYFKRSLQNDVTSSKSKLLTKTFVKDGP